MTVFYIWTIFYGDLALKNRKSKNLFRLYSTITAQLIFDYLDIKSDYYSFLTKLSNFRLSNGFQASYM